MTTLAPSLVVALTASRLRDADEALSRKLDASTVQASLGGRPVVARSRFNATERRVLGLVRAASAMISGPDPVDVPRTSVLHPGPSRYAVLGSAGFEIPAYADMLSLTPAWRAATLRRGTPDPFLATVSVPTATFVNAVGARMKADGAASPDRTRRGEAFTMGLVAAFAHAAVAAPVARAAYGRTTARPWERRQPTQHHAVDLTAGLRLIGGDDPVKTYASWWPEPQQAGELFESYLRALEDTYRLESRGPEARGWPAFETAFVPGAQLDRTRALAGYRRLVSGLVPFTMGAWFGVLTPILLAPGITLLISGALPASSAFIQGREVTERSVSELITLADGVNSITPFIYSMIMWAGVDDQPTEPFVSALWTFILRLALTAGWIPTIGSEREDPSPAGRWVSAGGMLGVDVYALIRFFAALNDRQPGPSVAFGMQIIPVVMTAVTTIQAGLTAAAVKIAREAGAGDEEAETTGWITTAVTAVGLWLTAGLTLAHGLANGSGWLSWFATDRLPSVRGAFARAARTPFTLEPAAVFDDSALWHDPAVAAPALTDLRYPTGGRPLVKVWRAAGSPELGIAHDGHRIRIRNGATITDVPIGPGARTVDRIAAALAALDHVEATAADAGPRYDLPFPAAVADPTDDRDPRVAVGDPARTAFVPIPDDPEKPYLLRHSPDTATSTAYGTTGPSTGPFDGLRGVPLAGLADAEDTVLGSAADLALILGLGAASRMRDVTPVAPDPATVPGAPAVPGPIGAVNQVFRNWNLDYRRINEWRTIVAGGAAREVPPPADPDLAEGARIADAMGWVALWRAWLRAASDTRSDTAAAVASADTPAVHAADGSTFTPTNAQLTLGIRYLLDLPV